CARVAEQVVDRDQVEDVERALEADRADAEPRQPLEALAAPDLPERLLSAEDAAAGREGAELSAADVADADAPDHDVDAGVEVPRHRRGREKALRRVPVAVRDPRRPG